MTAPPAEATTVHTRLLRITLAEAESQAYWANDAPGLSPQAAAAAAFEGGFIPQLLGFELCQRMRRVVMGREVYAYVDPMVARLLDDRREELRPLLARIGPAAIQMDDGVARWWTFAGGRINHTIKYGLEWVGGWKVVADNFQLRVEGDGVSHESVAAALRRIAAEGFWDEADMRHAVLTWLPEYRLSKFQRALPEAASLEMVGDYLFDIPGTVRFLTAARVSE